MNSISSIRPSVKILKKYKKYQKYLTDKNIFIFGIKPSYPSPDFGYFLSRWVKNKHKVLKFIEKPSLEKAKKIIKKNAYWNSGMFFLTKKSIINNFRKYQNRNFNCCLNSVNKSKLKNLLSATPSSIKAKNIVAMIAVHSVSSLVIYNLLSRFF